MLAADNGHGENAIVIPERPVPDGAKVTLMAELMDAARVARTLDRMAHEIVERHPELAGTVLIGVRSRGVPLALRLARLVEAGERRRPARGGARHQPLSRRLHDHRSPARDQGHRHSRSPSTAAP